MIGVELKFNDTLIHVLYIHATENWQIKGIISDIEYRTPNSLRKISNRLIVARFSSFYLTFLVLFVCFSVFPFCLVLSFCYLRFTSQLTAPPVFFSFHGSFEFVDAD